MGVLEHVIGQRSSFGRWVSPWLFRLPVVLALGGCTEKFLPATADPDGGSAAAPGSGWLSPAFTANTPDDSGWQRSL